MGLGAFPDVTLAQARDDAQDAYLLVRKGIDPIHHHQRKKREASLLTLGEAIDGCFEAKKAELKGDGEAGRWLSPLSVHVIPKIGGVPLTQVPLAKAVR